MKKIGIGRQAEVYEDSSGLAVKIFRKEVPIEHIEYEADISKKVAEVYYRASRFFGIWYQEERYGLRFELIKGNILSNQMSRHLLRIKRYAREFGELHREMHSIHIAGIPSIIDKFNWRIRQYKDLDSNILDKLLEFLENSQGKSLCHGDLHLNNVMIDEQEKMRVIDWVDAYYGDPISDVARTYCILSKSSSTENKPYFIRVIENILKQIIARTYLHSYFRDQPMPKNEFTIWKLIIEISRYSEGIQEEQAFLRKSISLGIKRCKFTS